MAVERWTDEMLDELTSSVREMRGSITELRGSVTELRESVTELRGSVTELRDGMAEMRDNIDGLRITAQALLQVAAQNQQKMDNFEQEIELMKQQQAESDRRFNVLLEEVRYLIRGIKKDEEQ